MLVNREAELMYPSLEGLGALACTGCFDTCSCAPISKDISKSSLSGLSSLGSDAWQSWYCQGFLAPSVFPWCVPPTPSEVLANDTSMFGSQLSQANRDKATQMAANIVANDPSLQPDGSNINWWLVGGGILVAIVIVKRI